MTSHRVHSSLVTLSSLALVASLFGSSAGATVITAEDYPFPYHNAYEATLVDALLKGGKDFHPEKDSLTDLVPNRHDVAYLEGRDQLDYEVNIVNPQAPLVFVLTGMGGASSSGTSEYIADHLGRAGMNSVTLASPYYWRFTLVASESGISGVVTDDARALYNEMKIISSLLKSSNRISNDQVSFVGYSMGAFEGVEIAKVDREEKELNFSTVLLINPPMDLTYGISVLDSMYRQGLMLGSEKINDYLSILEEKGEPLLAADIDEPGYFVDLQNRLGLPVEGAKFLVAETLETTASDLVMASQSIHQTLPSSVLPTPLNATNRDLREHNAARFNLGAYMKEIVVPSFTVRNGLVPGSEDYAAKIKIETSLNDRIEEMAADPRIQIMHNADDFITAPADLQALVAGMPSDQIVVYPYGGHVENVWFPENMKHMLNTLKQGFRE